MTSLQEIQTKVDEGPKMFLYIEREWHRSLSQTGMIPEGLTRCTELQCTPDEIYRLAQLEEAFRS
ncbi:hypothetical protein FVEN_g12754 [Fusarium venenatum]|uniref:Uncharacterized protein n=1 Tax=Fusarium venenatum TaxID=56646 RepID=A0A2L2TGW3_9HYPO|nr:uncharacterized protein FVRRES_09316 [Fusarium venenatum]KAG8358176.1 hypothetical protein FVEN_g12754 [Fusarium venenatum]CEI69239.1 unnamed protein product [Fusarium venenatum]